MTKFFERLTRENWGFPWHIIIAHAGTVISIVLLNLMVTVLSLTFIILITVVLVNLIGIVNEMLQRRRNAETRRGSIQDIAANNAGILIGVVEYLMLTAL